MAFVLMAALGSLSLVSYFSRISADNIRKMVLEAKRSNDRIVEDQSNLSSLSRFKAMMAPKRQAGDTYRPFLYAFNYYDLEWKFSGSLGGSKIAKFSVPSSDVDPETAIRFFQENKPISQMKKNVFLVELRKTNRNLKNSHLVESIDIDVKGLSNKKKFAARIPIAAPKPTGVKIVYRRMKVGDFSPLVPGVDLSNGPFEFQVLASGVVFDALIKVNGSPIQRVGGVDKSTNRISHNAISYSAENVPLSAPFSLRVLERLKKSKNSSAAGYSSIDAVSAYDRKNCSLNEKKLVEIFDAAERSESSVETASIEAIVFGPDHQASLSTGPISVILRHVSSRPTSKSKTGAGDKLLSEKDYSQLCNIECPYKQGIEGIELLPSKSNYKIAGSLTVQFAKILKIKSFKACIDMTNFSPSDSLSESPFLVYDVRTCKSAVLFKGGEWPLNCQ